LELKLIADVGLVGFPNAGKSTLISALTAVHVKIAPYPFTTLRPNLGYLYFGELSRVLIADIPGIIAGASQDKGLGLEFLRHIERTKVVVYVIDSSAIDGRDPFEDFNTLQSEIRAYNASILEKPFFVLLNKSDVEESAVNIESFSKKYPYDASTLMVVSAQEKQGLVPFVSALRNQCEKSTETPSL